MYKMIIHDTVEQKIPKKSIKAFALYQALQRGITQGNIHDEASAIAYLNTIGIKVEEV